MLANLSNNSLYRNMQIIMQKGALLHESDISQLNLKPSTKIE